jgi:hypothetical protein
VIFVPFDGGKPAGQPMGVLTGFLDERDGDAGGRPIGLALVARGALLVADDVGNVVWSEAESLVAKQLFQSGAGGLFTPRPGRAPARLRYPDETRARPGQL